MFLCWKCRCLCFFVLSGFVLSYAILNKNKDIEKKIFSMSVKRYPRLAIPALIAVLLFWSAFQLDLNMTNASAWVARLGTQSGPFLDAIYDGTIRSFILGKSNYNWVLWTMQVELFGSFIVFSIIYLYTKQKILAFLFAMFSIAISAAVFSINFGLGISCFIIGVIFYLYGKKINLLTATLMLSIGLYLAGIHNTSYSYQWIYKVLGEKSYILITIASAPFIVYSILMNEQVSNLLDKKPLVFLGKLSFSIYLLHLLVIYLFAMPLYNFLLEDLGFLISSLIASILTILVSILVSIPYSNYIDDLSIKVGKMIEKKLIK
ncbi:acyltransferase [Acinetobacter sp. 226-4]|uniref:acyltransferase family protein n=1 Tax=Acinetobacter sp. 226-4 TaxID=2746719 RepID=UPI00336A8019